MAGARGPRHRSRGHAARNRSRSTLARGRSRSRRCGSSTSSPSCPSPSGTESRAGRHASRRRCSRAASTSSAFTRFPDSRPARRSGSIPRAPTCCSPHDPQRPEKRHDLARAVAGAVPLLTLGDRSGRGSAVGQRGQRRAPAVGARGLRDWRCSRRSRATYRCSRPRPGSRQSSSTAWRAPTAGRSSSTRGAQALAPHLAAADPRIAGPRARRASTPPIGWPPQVVAAWRELGSNG